MKTIRAAGGRWSFTLRRPLPPGRKRKYETRQQLSPTYRLRREALWEGIAWARELWDNLPRQAELF